MCPDEMPTEADNKLAQEMIHEGSVVRLRSGGCAMTISAIEYSSIRGGNVARCHWIDESGQGREYTFPLVVLVKH